MFNHLFIIQYYSDFLVAFFCFLYFIHYVNQELNYLIQLVVSVYLKLLPDIKISGLRPSDLSGYLKLLRCHSYAA